MDKPWTVRASWQSGLVFALFTTMIACQQSMRLHRFSAHPEGLKYIRASLVGRRGPHSKEPSRLQVYAWETSILLLTCSIICAITGLALLVWFAAIYDDNDDFNSLKEDNYKVGCHTRGGFPFGLHADFLVDCHHFFDNLGAFFGRIHTISNCHDVVDTTVTGE